MRLVRQGILAGWVGFQLAACDTGGGAAREQSIPGIPEQEPRTSVRIQGGGGQSEGGQTGGEGGCAAPRQQQLVFDADDVRALVLGRYETTLARRPMWQFQTEPSGARGKRMVVEVSARGEPVEIMSCGDRFIEFPVEVKLSLDEPPLDVIIEETFLAYNADAAGLNVDLPADVARQMGLLEGLTVASEGEHVERPASLELWFGADGPRGRLWAEGNCDALVFPEDRVCVSYGSTPLPVSGDALREALRGFDALRALPVTLPDGTNTTLDVELHGEPERLCSAEFPAPVLYENSRLAAVSARLRTADARIDVLVDGQLQFDVSAPQDAWHFTAWGILPPGVARSMPYFSTITEQQLVGLNFSASLSSGGPIHVFHGFEVDTFDANATRAKLVEPLWGASADVYEAGCIDGEP